MSNNVIRFDCTIIIVTRLMAAKSRTQFYDKVETLCVKRAFIQPSETYRMLVSLADVFERSFTLIEQRPKSP